MKDFTIQYSLLLISASFIAGTFCSMPALAGNDTKMQNRPTIRITTGIEQVQGWEQGLVRANPNLARWHWDTIYSYKQGYAKIAPEPAKLIDRQSADKGSGRAGNPAYNYNVPAQQDNRPKHIPFSSKALEEVQARYALPAKPRHEDNVYGKLTSRQTQASILPPVVATYGYPYTSRERADTSLKYNSNETAVYGQLLNEKAKAPHNRAKIVRQLLKNNKVQ